MLIKSIQIKYAYMFIYFTKFLCIKWITILNLSISINNPPLEKIKGKKGT